MGGLHGTAGRIWLPISSGLLLAAAFPRPAISPLAWVALVPLLVALEGASLRGRAAAGLAAGFVFFSALLYWIGIFGVLPWFLLSLIQATFVVLFAILYGIVARTNPCSRLLIVPAIWTACEWLRSLGLTGFTWGDLAISQYRNLSFVQLASVTGTWGLTYLLVASNVAVAQIALRWRSPARGSALLRLAVVAVVAAGVHVWGWRQMSAPGHGTPLRAAVVQGSFSLDVPPTSDYSAKVLGEYEKLTLSVARTRPDLIVWPETVVVDDFAARTDLQRRIGRLAKEMNAYLLVGAPTYEGRGTRRRLFNGAFLFDRQGRLTGRYYKTHLVPYGEFVPLRRFLPFLERYRVTDEDYSPGPEVKPIGDFGVAICFESIFPEISRELARSGARLLVVMTYDGWFKRTSAAEQHLAFSIFRAVENRRWVVRNAGTGISCFVHPTGRVTDRIAIWKRGVAVRDVQILGDSTFSTRHGDWFAILCGIAAVAWLSYAAGWGLMTDR